MPASLAIHTDMRIAEIYCSRQGEGFLTGTESVFVRTSGCNLRCWFCDTPYTSWQPEGEDMSVPDVLCQLERFGCEHVVVTGGEPMLLAELIPLCEMLRHRGGHITIETAGTLHLPLECDLMSISPKLSNSTPTLESAGRWRARHERTRNAPEIVRRLVREYPYQVKFVVDQPADCDEIKSYLAGLPEIDQDRVLLMPQGTTIEKLEETRSWLEPYCQSTGWNFCPRKQIEWYGLTRGT